MIAVSTCTLPIMAGPMGFKSFPDVAEFAEFAEIADGRHAHGAESEQAVRTMLQRVRPNALERFGADDLATASQVLEGTFHDIDRAVEELRVQNEALTAARFDLEKSSAIFLALFERAPFAYLVTTTAAQITFANEAACRLLRRPKNALVKKPLACFVPLEEREAFREALARSCTSPAVATWPVSLIPTRADTSIRCRVHVGVMEDRSPGAPTLLYWNIMEETDEDLF